MQDRVSTLETAVDDAVNHGLRLECVNMLHDIVLITHLYVQRQASLGDPSARGGYDCAASARCKGRADEVTCFSACQGGYAATTHGQRGNSRNCSRNPQAMYGSVTKAIPKGSTPYRWSRTIGPSTTRSNQRLCAFQIWKKKRLCSRTPPYGARWICCKDSGKLR